MRLLVRLSMYVSPCLLNHASIPLSLSLSQRRISTRAYQWRYKLGTEGLDKLLWHDRFRHAGAGNRGDCIAQNVVLLALAPNRVAKTPNGQLG
jgi:hypothetical protein